MGILKDSPASKLRGVQQIFSFNVIINEFFSRINDYSLIEKFGSGKRILRDISLKEGVFLGSMSGLLRAVMAILLQGIYYLYIGRYLINPSFKIYFLDYLALISINIFIGI